MLLLPLPEGGGMLLLPLPLGEGWGEGNSGWCHSRSPLLTACRGRLLSGNPRQSHWIMPALHRLTHTGFPFRAKHEVGSRAEGLDCMALRRFGVPDVSELIHKPLQLFACDTITRIQYGIRRGLFTFIVHLHRPQYPLRLRPLPTTSSRNAAIAFNALRQLLPKPPEFILSDNGSEFMANFDNCLKNHRTTHFWTYPKSPKMNAHNERFNRNPGKLHRLPRTPATLRPDCFQPQQVQQQGRMAGRLQYQNSPSFLSTAIPDTISHSPAT